MQNPYAWAIISLLAVVSSVIAIYTWFAGKKKRRISYVCTTYEVVKQSKSTIPNFKLLFDDREIENLSIAKFVIWNSGNEMLEWRDIVPEQSLKIITTGQTVFLDAKIITVSDESNQFKIEKVEDETVDLSFDYVSVKEGIVIQIFYTGEIDDIEVNCKIKGGLKARNEGKVDCSNQSEKKKSVKLNIGAHIFAICILLVCFASALFKNADITTGDIYSMAMLVISSLIICYSLFNILKYELNVGVPKELRIYNN